MWDEGLNSARSIPKMAANQVPVINPDPLPGPGQFFGLVLTTF